MTEAPSQQRPGPVALSLLAVGFGLALAAQYLPWSSVKTGVASDDEDVVATSARSRVPATLDITLASLNTAHVVAYLATLVLALGAIAVVLTTTDVVRRVSTAAAAGLLAGNVLVLGGFKSAIDALGQSSFTMYTLPEDAVSVGMGYPLAIAATLLLLAGVVIAVRGPILRDRIGRRSELDETADGEPLDLTVTPAPPSHFQ
ncbi:hypothetical protein KZZ52_59365 [Dactylosporangium sp. AC04546]|uniref:hypothetical protein n=1 Tax=Dactylosporangium sp. AC04546 TaxID=2862460 RepID=UPI001EDDC9E3|nr:hypothetical protein [Dactylosporangium sp. AC04546]WVK83740.1 hypothetical protein KZZ52_59365 [Dactylosporangium sp. AC04546]